MLAATYRSLLGMCNKKDRFALKYFDLYRLKMWPEYYLWKFSGNTEECALKDVYGCVYVYISLGLDVTHMPMPYSSGDIIR